MGEMRITSVLKLYTLLVLSERERHGYELMKEIGGKLGRRASAGEIYPFLHRLQKRKYVEIEERGGRGKKVFKLTQSGRKFVSGLLRQFGDLISMAVERKLSTCAHCGCRIYEGGMRKRIRGKSEFFCCESCADAKNHQ